MSYHIHIYAFPSAVPFDACDTVSAACDALAPPAGSVSPHTSHGIFSFNAALYFG